jgi:hypothetical protein
VLLQYGKAKFLFAKLYDPNLYEESAALHLDNGTVAEVGGEEGRVNGRRHQDDPHLGVGVHHVPQHHQQEVAIRIIPCRIS